jgi:outer membrane protein TolC
MRSFFIFFLVFLFKLKAVAQAQPVDTMPVLSFEQYLQIIKDNHPTAKQAALLTKSASIELMGAKGGFDPKLFGDYEQKNFDGKNYWTIGEYGVKVPTWYGIEVKGSYNTAVGTNLNSEEKLPKQGQAVIGVSVPLLQNLVLDERRANLQKARLTQGLNQAERDILLLDLSLEAAKIYWKWAFSYQQMKTYQKALSISEQRFQAIKSSFLLGDRMAMDTLESFTQVQDRAFQYNESVLDFQEYTLKLSNFMWSKDAKPMNNITLLKPPNFVATPLSITVQSQEEGLQNLEKTHPALQLYAFKINQLDIDRRLKMEKLKPKLNVHYNILGNGFNIPVLFTDNYKWGLSFSSSTLFRSERSDVQLARIKIDNTHLMREQKALELQNKLRLAFTEIDNLTQQIALYSQTVNNYQKLLELENARFELGESTFFLINSREMKYLEAQIKLAKLVSEYRIALVQVDWANGKISF